MKYAQTVIEFILVGAFAVIIAYVLMSQLNLVDFAKQTIFVKSNTAGGTVTVPAMVE